MSDGTYLILTNDSELFRIEYNNFGMTFTVHLKGGNQEVQFVGKDNEIIHDPTMLKGTSIGFNGKNTAKFQGEISTMKVEKVWQEEKHGTFSPKIIYKKL